MTLASVDQARAAMLGATPQMPEEVIALSAALGRTLAAPVLATRDQPPFIASAMDGWAVRASDVERVPASLQIVGESAAGAGFFGTVMAGQAIRVFTGAPVPDGADHVVMQENAERAGEIVAIKQTSASSNIRPRAGDFAANTKLLKVGTLLDAAALGVAASSGNAALTVYRKPRIHVLTTGPELVAPSAAPRPDQIFESNTFAVAALLNGWGAEVAVAPTPPDFVDGIATAIDGLAGDAELIVLIGGASVGDYDFAKPALAKLGLRPLVDKIAVRPGKPTWFGVLPNNCLVLGLPGNPASAQVCSHLFLAPIVRHMMGRLPWPTLQTARTSIPLPTNSDREHWMRARIDISVDGVVEARAFRDQDSSLQTVLAAANGLVRRAINAPAATAGDRVEVLLTGPL